MSPRADTLVPAGPLTGPCDDDPVTRAASCTHTDLDAMEAIQALQVEEVAYRATLQALERPFVAGLHRFLG